MKLPQELRLKIYGFLMNDVLEEEQSHGNVKVSKMISLRASRVCSRKLSSQLLRTCKIVYEEGMPALYRRRAVKAEQMEDLRHLNEIGAFACSFLEVVVIGPDKFPKYMEQRNKTELRALGTTVPPPLRIPPLPSLKTVVLSYMANHGRSPSPPQQRLIEEWAKSLVQSKPSRHHFLFEFMGIADDPSAVTWRLDLRSCSHQWTDIEGLLAKPPTRRIWFDIEVSTVQDAKGKEKKRWRVKNVDGGAVKLWGRPE